MAAICLHKKLFSSFVIALGIALIPVNPAVAQDRTAMAMKKNDKDGDGKVSRDEWKNDKSVFEAIDTDGDGLITPEEFRARFIGQGKPNLSESGKGGEERVGMIKGTLEPMVKDTNDAMPNDLSTSTTRSHPSAASTPKGLYFIDAHSQMDETVDEERVLSLMDRGGVHKTLISSHMGRPWQAVEAFQRNSPERIVGAAMIKGDGYYSKRSGDFFGRLKGQAGSASFGAMAEVLLWHDSDGGKYQEIRVDFNDELVRSAFEVAHAKGWPFIVHIEFASLYGSSRQNYLEMLKKMAEAYPEHPFVLIHMGQLEEPDLRRLFETHKNLYAMTSHADPYSAGKGGKPFVNIIDGDRLKPQWRQMMIDYPDRFIFALDNVFGTFWTPKAYLGKMRLWWSVASDLPAEVAHAWAHGNAERLWKLQPRHEGMIHPNEAMRALGPVTGHAPEKTR